MGLSVGHKTCIGLLMLLSLCVITGYLAPFWRRVQSRGVVTYDSGLFLSCAHSGSTFSGAYRCTVVEFNADIAWFEAVRGLCGGCALLMLILFITMICVLCSGNHNLMICTAATSTFAGLLGVAGSVLYIVKYLDGGGLGSQLFAAFYLFIVASGLIIPVSLPMFCMSRKSSQIV